MTGHAKLAPSAAYQWGPGRCPASAAIQRMFPEDPESERAREGTAAHEVAAGGEPTNGVPIDQAMREGAEIFMGEIDSILKKRTPGTLPVIEQHINAHRNIHPDNDGTPDCYVIDRTLRLLDVVDYKYGHAPHDPFEHYQLINYAIMALDSAAVTDWTGWQIRLVIVQPRCFDGNGPVKDWFLSGDTLRTWASEFAVAARLASNPNAPTKTGDWCRYCTGRTNCDAFARAIGNAIDVSWYQGITPDTPANVGLRLREITIAEARLKAARVGLMEVALGYRRSGTPVPHWRDKTTTGNLAWTVPPAEVLALGDMLGVPLRKEATITPTQAVKAGIPLDLIGAYAARPSGGLTLEPEDGTAAARVFGERPA